MKKVFSLRLKIFGPSILIVFVEMFSFFRALFIESIVAFRIFSLSISILEAIPMEKKRILFNKLR